MRAFRIARSLYVNDLSGFGAYQFGGRWNSKGTRIVYFADSPALALLEILVHIPNFDVATSYALLTIDIPDSISILHPPELPVDWRNTPGPIELQRIGDQFIKDANGLVLRVPSCIIPMSSSFLVNPLHPDFAAITIIGAEPFVMEKRLFGVRTGG